MSEEIKEDKRCVVYTQCLSEFPFEKQMSISEILTYIQLLKPENLDEELSILNEARAFRARFRAIEDEESDYEITLRITHSRREEPHYISKKTQPENDDKQWAFPLAERIRELSHELRDLQKTVSTKQIQTWQVALTTVVRELAKIGEIEIK